MFEKRKATMWITSPAVFPEILKHHINCSNNSQWSSQKPQTTSPSRGQGFALNLQSETVEIHQGEQRVTADLKPLPQQSQSVWEEHLECTRGSRSDKEWCGEAHKSPLYQQLTSLQKKWHTIPRIGGGKDQRWWHTHHRQKSQTEIHASTQEIKILER